MLARKSVDLPSSSDEYDMTAGGAWYLADETVTPIEGGREQQRLASIASRPEPFDSGRKPMSPCVRFVDHDGGTSGERDMALDQVLETTRRGHDDVTRRSACAVRSPTRRNREDATGLSGPRSRPNSLLMQRELRVGTTTAARRTAPRWRSALADTLACVRRHAALVRAHSPVAHLQVSTGF